MTKASVRFAEKAETDLKESFDFISERSGHLIAARFIGSLYEYCIGLSDFPTRGVLRNHLAPGLRLLGYKRQATIAFALKGAEVIILRILLKGRNSENKTLFAD